MVRIEGSESRLEQPSICRDVRLERLLIVEGNEGNVPVKHREVRSGRKGGDKETSAEDNGNRLNDTECK